MSDPHDELSYSYKPALMGAPWIFRLGSDALHWEKGATSGRIPYGDITRVRMSFKPATIVFDRYRLEIWSKRTPRIEVVSVSAKSMVEQEKQGPGYTRFAQALHRRLAGLPVRFDAGSPAYLYWPALIVFAGTTLAILGLIARALQTDAASGAALMALFLLVFAWQAVTFFRRNVPGSYRAGELPARLLPAR